jgi:signal transduction histidine kinase
MSPDATSHLVAAAIHLVPALVWGVLSYNGWRLRREMQLDSTLLRIAPIVTGVVALHFVLHALIELTPTELEGRLAGLHAVLEGVIEVAIVFTMALFRHLVPALAEPERPPSRPWLAVNYGSALAVSVAVVVSLVRGGWGPPMLPMVYALVVALLAVRSARPLARRGRWRAGAAVSELRSPDLVVMGVALLGTAVLALTLALTGSAAPLTVGGLFLHTAVGLALSVPFVVRMFGRMVRGFVMTTTALAATASVYAGAHALAARVPSAELGRLVDLAGIVALVLVLVPGRTWMESAIERRLFGRGRRRQAELQAFLHRLSPELGALECCRRALAELCRVMALRGAAIILRDGRGVAHGEFDLAPLTRVWPRGAAGDALPARAFSEGDLLRELPPELRDAVVEAEVVWLAPIVSPRRRWGHLFATEGLLTTPSSSEDVEEIAGFVGQLALVLAGAELLARAVDVERSLAHAEKLAAIGETAARIVHDIRNPVSAARSLAQQLAREPGSGFQAEHEVILGELERVERQVASLLGFARREEFHFATVDLGALVEATVEGFRPRLEEVGIAVELDVDGAVRLDADGEKLRQALINLIENAADALADAPALRRLAVHVGSSNGTASIRVTDSGPGVPEDALPRIFEPFFSGKPNGTGLGLAIAKRTVDAHGGHIVATRADGGGLELRLDLPLARGERSRRDA